MHHHYQLLKKLAKYTEDYFRHFQRLEFTYHIIDHTKYVVKAATKIAEHYGLTGDGFFVLISAVWFHDIGYFQGIKPLKRMAP